jgi:hypothetical protein
MRRILAVVVMAIGTIAAPSLAGSSTTDANAGSRNVALAENTTNLHDAVRTAVSVAHNPSDTIGNENAAVAKSFSCTGCRTAAVAVQIVLVEGNPSNVQPKNASAAVNAECDGCFTFAYAYQRVIQPGRPVYLSRAAQTRLAEIKGEIHQLVTTHLGTTDELADFQALEAELDRKAAEIRALVESELRQTGAPTTGVDSFDIKAA